MLANPNPVRVDPVPAQPGDARRLAPDLEDDEEEAKPERVLCEGQREEGPPAAGPPSTLLEALARRRSLGRRSGTAEAGGRARRLEDAVADEAPPGDERRAPESGTRPRSRSCAGETRAAQAGVARVGVREAEEALAPEEEEAGVVEWGGEEGLGRTGDRAGEEGDEDKFGDGGKEVRGEEGLGCLLLERVNGCLARDGGRERTVYEVKRVRPIVALIASGGRTCLGTKRQPSLRRRPRTKPGVTERPCSSAMAWMPAQVETACGKSVSLLPGSTT